MYSYDAENTNEWQLYVTVDSHKHIVLFFVYNR